MLFRRTPRVAPRPWDQVPAGTVLDYARTVFSWQFSAEGENTIEEECDTLSQFAGATVLAHKAMDGQLFQATFDSGPDAITGYGQFQALVLRAQAKGVTLLPWVVPHTAADAAAHAALGTTLIVDLEPYQQFWEDTAQNVPVYLAALRAGGVKTLIVCVDPRPQPIADLGLPTWVSSVDGVMGQFYWTDFRQSERVIVPMLDAEAALHTNLYPTFPYNATAGDLVNAWTSAVGDGAKGMALWRLGSANADQLRAFASLPLPQQPPADPCADLKQQLADVTADRDRLAGIIATAKKDLG